MRAIVWLDGDPYYPVPNQRNRDLYAKYQALAEKLEATGRIQFVGRLANYKVSVSPRGNSCCDPCAHTRGKTKYFNMDQAIDNALKLFDETAEARLARSRKKIQ